MGDPIDDWTRWAGPWLAETLKCQRDFLDAYETLLKSASGTRTEFNNVMKSSLSAWLSLVNSQFAMRDQILGQHLELLRQHRRMLEDALDRLKKERE
jgi:hypothetical protein